MKKKTFNLTFLVPLMKEEWFKYVSGYKRFTVFDAKEGCWKPEYRKSFSDYLDEKYGRTNKKEN